MNWFQVFQVCAKAGINVRPSEARVLAVLWDGDIHEYKAMARDIWNQDSSTGPIDTKSAIHLAVMELRNQRGFSILTYHGIGLQLVGVPDGVPWTSKEESEQCA